MPPNPNPQREYDVVLFASDDKTIRLRPRRLESFLTRKTFPSLALHTTILAATLLYKADKVVFAYLWPFFFIAFLCILVIWVAKMNRGDEEIFSRQTSALYGLGFLALIALMQFDSLPAHFGVSDGTLAALLIVGFLAFAFGTLHQKGTLLSMVTMAVYAAWFFANFSQTTNAVSLIGVGGLCLAVAAAIIIRSGKKQYLFGVLVGGVLVLAIGSTDGSLWKSTTIITVSALLLLLVLLIYEGASRIRQYSDFVRLIAQAIGAAIIWYTIGLIFPDLNASQQYLATAAGFSAYSMLAHRRGGRSGVSTRVLLVLFLLISSALNLVDISTTVTVIIQALAGLGIVLVSHFFQSTFIRFFANIWFVLALVQAYSLMSNIELNIRIAERADDATEASIAQAYEAARNSGFMGLFAAVLFLVGATLFSSLWRTPPPGRNWWTGLIAPRTAVVIRNGYRTFSRRIYVMPALGGFALIVLGLIKALHFMSGKDRPLQLFGAMSALAYVIAALSTVATVSLRFLLYPPAIAGFDPLFWGPVIAISAGWSFWGLALSVNGALRGVLYSRLLGFVFSCIPIMFVWMGLREDGFREGGVQSTSALWVVLVLSGIAILVSSVLPNLRGFAKAKT